MVNVEITINILFRLKSSKNLLTLVIFDGSKTNNSSLIQNLFSKFFQGYSKQGRLMHLNHVTKLFVAAHIL